MSVVTCYQTERETLQTYCVECQRQYSTNLGFFDGSPIDCYLMSFIKMKQIFLLKETVLETLGTKTGS